MGIESVNRFTNRAPYAYAPPSGFLNGVIDGDEPRVAGYTEARLEDIFRNFYKLGNAEYSPAIPDEIINALVRFNPVFTPQREWYSRDGRLHLKTYIYQLFSARGVAPPRPAPAPQVTAAPARAPIIMPQETSTPVAKFSAPQTERPTPCVRNKNSECPTPSSIEPCHYGRKNDDSSCSSKSDEKPERESGGRANRDKP